MPYDAGVACAISFELNDKIKGGRIEKIFQPTKETVVLQIYSHGERYRLAIDAEASSPKVYLTAHEFENPPTPLPFYNALRKYLMNGRIKDVNLVGFDRVFEMTIDSNDEMGYTQTFCVYAECIRKQSNIILCSGNEIAEGRKIIAAAKTVSFDLSETRQILPGLIYEPPVSEKTNPLLISKADFEADLADAPFDLPVSEYLLNKYQGFSPLVTREIALRAAKSMGEAARTDISVGEADKSNLSYYFFELIDNLKSGKFAPCVIYSGKAPEEKLIDFSYIDIRQYGRITCSGNGELVATKNFESMSSLVDYYFYKKEFDNKIKQKANDIFKALTNASSRLVKKIKVLERDLAECDSREKLKIYGDLITANIYRLEKGMTEYELENFYEDNELVKIAADKNLTPAQNAQRFYKRYGKLKSAEYHLNKQIESAQDDIMYIDSVFDALTRALSERELAEIRDELAESGIMRGAFSKSNKSDKSQVKSKSNAKRGKAGRAISLSKPEEYTSPNGFKILCGRNNKQNDNLTFRLAGRNDIWFHAQKIPGSHVVLLCETTGRTPENADIEEAARIAATNSKGKNMPLVSVDYAPVRYVKKPPGAKPGFVTYTNFKTAAVKPS